MRTNPSITDKKMKIFAKKIVEVLKKYPVKKASIIGSYSRGEQTNKSDIDIVIELSRPIGFDFVQINIDLEKALKKKVDLLTYKSLNPLIREQILSKEMRIL